MTRFDISGKIVSVYPAKAEDRPIIYLNIVKDESDAVRGAMKDISCPDCTLVTVGGLDWDRDMSPWECQPISKGDTPCTGGADAFLSLLTGQIIPSVESALQKRPSWRGLAGYSLAGLFAIYALYRTDEFCRVASCSGSLWFPGFDEYVYSHEMVKSPSRLYFSLGDRECKTRNPYLRTVQEKTENIFKFFQGAGLDTCFTLNPGNHFQDCAARCAAGIKWLAEI